MQRQDPLTENFELGYAPPTSRVEDSGDLRDRPRKVVLAFLASFLAPPMAFAYAGRLMFGSTMYYGFLVLCAALGWSGLAQTVGGAWLVYGATLVVTLGGLVLPSLFARAGARRYRLKAYNRWYCYVLLVVVQVGVLVALLHKAQVFGFLTYTIPSGSMAPTLAVGDLVVADTRPATLAALKPGDIVTFTNRRDPDQSWVKRIVAGPGQHVHIDESGLKVDGHVQDRAHVQGSDMMEARLMQFSDVTLGPDEFYVLGDNRGNSLDSRTEGPVARSRVQSKVTAIFYSRDANRIGKVE